MKNIIFALALLFALPASAQFGHRNTPSWSNLGDTVKTPATITATGALATCPGIGCVTVTTWGASTVFATLSGTWAGTMQFSCSNDNWATVKPMAAYSLINGVIGGTGQISATANGDFAFPTVGFSQCGVYANPYTSGTVSVRLDADPSAFFSASQTASPGHRMFVALDADAPVALTASDAVLTFTLNKNGAVTGAQTTYPVAAGKTLRVQEIHCTLKQTSATSTSAIVRLRLNTAGACVVGSGLVQTVQVPAPSGTAAAELGNPPVTVTLGDGLEFTGASWNVCVSAIGSSANGTIQCGLTGYEY
jgi:hypothetical protein